MHFRGRLPADALCAVIPGIHVASVDFRGKRHAAGTRRRRCSKEVTRRCCAVPKWRRARGCTTPARHFVWECNGKGFFLVGSMWGPNGTTKRTIHNKQQQTYHLKIQADVMALTEHNKLLQCTRKFLSVRL